MCAAILPARSPSARNESNTSGCARVLRRLARWSKAPVVAFTQFNATAAAFYRQLRNLPGIAWLGGNTAHITSGVIAREEAIERLLSARFRDRHDGIRLLITTDVVSEGLSLSGVAKGHRLAKRQPDGG